MDKSVQLRKQKAKDRMRLRRRVAERRAQDISIAASALSCHRDAPLILRKVTIPQFDADEEY